MWPLVTALLVILLTLIYYFYEPQDTSQSLKKEPATSNPPTKPPPAAPSKPSHDTTTTTKSKKTFHIKTVNPTSHPHFIQKFGGHAGSGAKGHVFALAISPNGEWLATAGDDGQLRVTRVDDKKLFLSIAVAPTHSKRSSDRVRIISWAADNRTLVCGVSATPEGDEMDVAFYRMRRKPQSDTDEKQSSFPYELIELVKHRFGTSDKLEEVSSSVVDRGYFADVATSAFSLIITGGTPPGGTDMCTAVAWDGGTGTPLGTVKLGSGRGDGEPQLIRLSPDGDMVCCRGGGSSTELKIYGIRRKHVKGRVEPVFDKFMNKCVITCKSKIADVDFFSSMQTVNQQNENQCDRVVLACVNGEVQIWDVSVDQKPKQLCFSTHISKTEDIVRPVAIVASADGTKIAVATDNSTLHIFTHNEDKKGLTFEFSIRGVHTFGIADLQFSPPADCLYTLGASSKEVFAWKTDC